MQKSMSLLIVFNKISRSCSFWKKQWLLQRLDASSSDWKHIRTLKYQEIQTWFFSTNDNKNDDDHFNQSYEIISSSLPYLLTKFWALISFQQWSKMWHRKYLAYLPGRELSANPWILKEIFLKTTVLAVTSLFYPLHFYLFRPLNCSHLGTRHSRVSSKNFSVTLILNTILTKKITVMEASQQMLRSCRIEK